MKDSHLPLNASLAESLISSARSMFEFADSIMVAIWKKIASRCTRSPNTKLHNQIYPV